MKKITIRDLTIIALMAALYVVLTLVFSPLSYGAIQFRISEVLILLVFYNRKYSISLIIGCLIANIFSPVGYLDIIFGTLATAISVIPMMFIKNIYLSSIIPSIVNGLIVGIELAYVYDMPYFLTMAQVFVGEFVVVSLLGIALFKSIEQRENVVEALDLKVNSQSKLNSYILLSLALIVLNVFMFFKLSIFNYIISNDKTIYFTLSYRFSKYNDYFYIIILILPIIQAMIIILTKKKLNIILSVLFSAIYIGIFIYSMKDFTNDFKISYLTYLLIPTIFLLMSINKNSLIFTKQNNPDNEE